jgi:peptide/nickel transport system substrate-binding protein
MPSKKVNNWKDNKGRSENKMMKKLLFLALIIVVVGGLLFAGCGTKTTTTTPPKTTTTPPPSTTKTTTTSTTTTTTITTTTSTTPTTTPTVTPKKGGTLRVLWQTGISNLSWIPKQGMTDEALSKAYSETLVYYAGTGEFLPELAKSWDIDSTAKTLTFHLQEGVKFQDGTPFNAEAVRWSVQNLIDSKRLANGQYVDSIEVVDANTFRYHLNAMMTPSIMLHSYGYNLLTMFSPTAFEKNGGKDNGGIDWAGSHYVSTGAFKFDSWTQDVSLKITRFDGYWRGPQYPYLDAIEFTFVADTTIAKAKMQAGEADTWGGPPLKDASELEEQGFKLIQGKGGFYSELIPDNVSEGSVFKDQKVREAVEYAIDREALAIGLGYGKLQAVEQAGGPPSSTGFNPDYVAREYNVQKARTLLTEAGYPNGFPTKILVMQGGQQDMATAIQANLADVGIIADIDVADPGRFIGAIYQGGWAGEMLLWMVPIDPEFAIGWFVHFGPQPIFPYPSLKWPDTYKAAVEKVRLAASITEMRKATVDMMTLVSNGAYIIPLIDSINLTLVQPYVMTQMGQEHFMTWHNYLDWLNK